MTVFAERTTAARTAAAPSPRVARTFVRQASIASQKLTASPRTIRVAIRKIPAVSAFVTCYENGTARHSSIAMGRPSARATIGSSVDRSSDATSPARSTRGG